MLNENFAERQMSLHKELKDFKAYIETLESIGDTPFAVLILERLKNIYGRLCFIWAIHINEGEK